MHAPTRFADLPEYAFPRLRRLLGTTEPGAAPIDMSIGEPKHGLPELIAETIAAHAHEFGRYPPNEGAPELLEAIAAWVRARFAVALDPDEIVVLNGSREGLFNAALALSPETKAGRPPIALMPNPFYPCYAAAARAAGAEPVPVRAGSATGFLPDFAALPADLLDRATLTYVCSPSNPQGAVATAEYWRGLIALGERHGFRILADECYSEIYRDTPPVGALGVARTMGADPERVTVFNSLSKRSSAPGLRSGFAAGGRATIAALRKLRAYGGAPVPPPLQRASAALWRDEAHVIANRVIWGAKFDMADRILGRHPGYAPPRAGFFVWLRVGDGEAAARALWRQAGVRVLPGAYLTGAAPGDDPGAAYIRVALVAAPADVERGLAAIREALAETVCEGSDDGSA